jgi:hypothetical protein
MMERSTPSVADVSLMGPIARLPPLWKGPPVSLLEIARDVNREIYLATILRHSLAGDPSDNAVQFGQISVTARKV